MLDEENAQPGVPEDTTGSSDQPKGDGGDGRKSATRRSRSRKSAAVDFALPRLVALSVGSSYCQQIISLTLLAVWEIIVSKTILTRRLGQGC